MKWSYCLGNGRIAWEMVVLHGKWSYCLGNGHIAWELVILLGN